MHFKRLLPKKSVSVYKGIGSSLPVLLIFILILSVAFTNSWSQKSLAGLEGNIRVMGGPSDDQYLSTIQNQSPQLIWQSDDARLNNDFALASTNKSSTKSPSYLLSQNSLTNPNYPTNDNESENKISTYTIKKGDTISSIAEEFNISTNTIVWNNTLSKRKIYPGQEIQILPVSGLIHEVGVSESLAEIADFYSVDEKEIADFNDLSTNPLNPGNILIIPGGKISSINKNPSSSENLPYYPDYYLIPTTGINWGQIHLKNAVDIANHCNTTIIASAEGLIIEAGYMTGYGNYIKIQHPNGTETLYAHLENILIEKGDFVDRGEIIGVMGNTGRSTGCHLHFEVRGAINPFGR